MKSYTITVNGVAYNVTVEENNGADNAPAVSAPVQSAAAQAPVAKTATASGSIKVEAPMPGNILDIKVSQGAGVKGGQTLIILEAMKMENDIVAPADGTIASINVNKGDTVEAGQVMITLN